MGRPVTVYTPKRIAEIKKAMNKYIDESAIPILAEFAFNNDIRRQTLYEIPELADTTKRMMEKKEFQIEKMAITGEINTAFSIFSLKQMGWSDKQQIDLSGKINLIIDNDDNGL